MNDTKDSSTELVENFYSNGKLQYRWGLKNGQLNGLSECFSVSGQPLSIAWYQHGLADSECKRFYLNGTLKDLERWDNGLLDGLQENFFPSGHIKSKFPYVKGKLNGEVEIFHENGKLAKSVPYQHGVRNGVASEWNSNGVLTCSWWYNNGMMTREVDYYPDGSKLREKLVHADSGLHDLYEWDRNGVLRKKGLHEGAIYHVWEWNERGEQSYEGVGHWDKDESIAHLKEVKS